jgi:outer membrane protein assembly factor BamA
VTCSSKVPKRSANPDILKEFREKRVGVSKEAVYDPVKARAATRTLREMLAAKGYPNAKVTVQEDEVSATSIAVTFDIDQGNKSRIIQIDFEGNQHFSDKELRNALVLVKEDRPYSRGSKVPTYSISESCSTTWNITSGRTCGQRAIFNHGWANRRLSASAINAPGLRS